jgi:hypothetical protein
MVNSKGRKPYPTIYRARESLVHGEGKPLKVLIQLKNNVRDVMRNSEKVLNGLSKHSPQLEYRYERLYKNLFNEEMFMLDKRCCFCVNLGCARAGNGIIVLKTKLGKYNEKTFVSFTGAVNLLPRPDLSYIKNRLPVATVMEI